MKNLVWWVFFSLRNGLEWRWIKRLEPMMAACSVCATSLVRIAMGFLLKQPNWKLLELEIGTNELDIVDIIIFQRNLQINSLCQRKESAVPFDVGVVCEVFPVPFVCASLDEALVGKAVLHWGRRPVFHQHGNPRIFCSRTLFPEMAIFRYHDVNSSRWEGSEFLREKTTQLQVGVHGHIFSTWRGASSYFSTWREVFRFSSPYSMECLK